MEDEAKIKANIVDIAVQFVFVADERIRKYTIYLF